MEFGNKLRGLERSLDCLSLRHQVMANNVANINTPGFHRSEVRFEDALLHALGTPELPNDGQGPGAANGSLHSAMETWQPTVSEVVGAQRIDGNSVSLETEMSGMSKNTLSFNTVTTVIAEEYRTLKTVIDAK